MDLFAEPVRKQSSFDYALPIRVGAKVISYLFHPVFIPLYVALFMIHELRLFPSRTDWQQTVVFLQFVVYYTFLPLVTTALLKGLGFIDSIHLRSRKDRILPFVVCEIFYFWAWYVFKNLPDFPAEAVMFGLGVFLATSLGLILNAYMKISMHAISLGVLCAFVLLASLRSSMSFGLYISIAFLVTGLTCTARLIDSDHTTQEIYTGLFCGGICMLIASFFV